jgi:hypothetical protein
VMKTKTQLTLNYYFELLREEERDAQSISRVEKETQTDVPVNTQDLCAPIVLLPVDHWSGVSEKALRFAWGLSDQIRVLHVECGEETESLCRNWNRLVEAPAKEANLLVLELVLLTSPF